MLAMILRWFFQVPILISESEDEAGGRSLPQFDNYSTMKVHVLGMGAWKFP